jgi:ABC-2 type transport system permease protein
MIGNVLAAEIMKLRRSKVPALTWLACGIMPIVGGLFMWIVKEPERAGRLGLLGQKAQLVGLGADWSGYLQLLLQAMGLGGMLLVSVIAAYVFGREYADGTAKNLLTLPVARHWFVAAKLAVVLLWFAALTVSLIVEGFVVAWFLGLPGWTLAIAGEAIVDLQLAALVGWMLTPVVAWIAALGRGYLAPMGFTIFMLVMGNVLGATGWGRWFPWSIVPLFAGVAGPRVETLASGSLLVLVLTFAAGTAATMLQFRYGDNVQ